MTVLITCGFQKSWCDFAQDLLQNMGVADASDASRSAMNPEDLTSKICKQHRLDFASERRFRQIMPGKAWQITAADLFVSNADKDTWGWADNRNIYFLDFWRDFDPHCRFLLLYGSPAQSLSCDLDSNGSLPDDLDGALAGWTAYQEELIRFYNKHRDQCLLVHVDTFRERTAEFAALVNARFETDLRLVNSAPEFSQPRMLQFVAEALLRDERGKAMLHAELESAADIASESADDLIASASAAHLEFIETKRALDAQLAISSDREAALACMEDVKRELQLKVSELEELVASKSAASDEARHLREDLFNVQDELRAHNQIVAAKTRENDLMLRQLHQVQEELETYFSKYQELKASTESGRDVPSGPSAAPTASALVRRAAGFELDMRSFVNGSGWHSPEDQGRWAGPGVRSLIKLPRLEEEKYLLELQVIDAMSLNIAKNIRLKFDGHDIHPSFQILSNIGGRLAPVRRMRAQLRNVEKPYPMRILAIIPTAIIKDAGESHTLEILAPQVVSPAASGQPDTRALSICVQTVKLKKSQR